jgi:outer membrane immunogenic protein
MTLTNSGIVAGAVALSITGTAHAAQFDGPHVGAQVGWQSEKMNYPETSFGPVPIDGKKQSVTTGIYAGYDKRINDKVVIGAETGLDFATDDEVQVSDAGTSYSIDPKYSIDLTARAGFLLNPQTLVYARGGYTNARIRTTISDGLGTESASSSQDGWLAGVGVERSISDIASARIEYRYSKLSEGDGEDKRNRLLAGVSYRF